MFSFSKKKRWSYDLTSVDETEKEAEIPETKEAHEPRRSLNIRASFKYFGLNDKKKDKNHDKVKAKDNPQRTGDESKTTEDKPDGSDVKDQNENNETEFLKCDRSTESPSKEKSEGPSAMKEKEDVEENPSDESQNEAEMRKGCSEAKLKKRPSFLEEVLAETASLNLSGKEVEENKN